MKKIIVLIICILIFSVKAIAAINPTVLSDIENNIFGYDFKKESDLTRIERIEKNLYGNKKTGDINKRIENIKADIGYVNIKEQKTQSLPNKKAVERQIKEEDSSVEYPTVDAMEKQVFNTVYKKENIYSRLNRLEEHVFNQTSSENLSDRVNRLAMVLLPQKHAKASIDENKQLPSVYNQDYYNYSDDSSFLFQLGILEQSILKNQYGNDTNINRLNRLEQALFSKTYPFDSDEARIQRLSAAYEAKKDSYKYENNRKMQNMAATTQIGGFLLLLLSLLL